jgi:MerR family copper efflux transcriptional regulator
MGMTIGELARRGGVGVETVRYYQRSGLLEVPTKTRGGRRMYSPTALAQLRFIRRCQGLGLSLDEIKAVLRLRRSPSSSCTGLHVRITETLATVEAKRRTLEIRGAMLRELLLLCSGNVSLRACKLLASLDNDELDAGRAGKG